MHALVSERKRDNEAARRLYERCGLRVECEGWAVEMDWSSADNLLDDSVAVVAFIPDVQQELATCARFGLEPERLARRRASGHIVPCALREGDSIAGFASFDPASPGAFPFCVARPGLARSLLASMKRHAHLASFGFVRLMVLGDGDLVAVLRGAGAEVTFELVQMGAPLGEPT